MVASTVVTVPYGKLPLEAAEKFVKSKGARRMIGQGCYGAVWASNEGKRGSGNRVYKVCNTEKNRTAYLPYVQVCIDELKGNTHVPRIYSVTEFVAADIYREDDYTVICMEKLAPVGEPNGNPLNGCGYTFESGEHFNSMNMMYDTVRHGTNKDKFNPEMFKALEVIGHVQRKWSCCLDIHSGNVMLRGNILVITDPLS